MANPHIGDNPKLCGRRVRAIEVEDPERRELAEELLGEVRQDCDVDTTQPGRNVGVDRLLA